MAILKSVSAIITFGLILSHQSFGGEPDNCSLKFTGSDRKAIKNRPVTTAEKENYSKFNGGNAITVDKWYEHVCELDGQLPDLKDISQTKPLPEIETVEITVRGYILAAQ